MRNVSFCRRVKHDDGQSCQRCRNLRAGKFLRVILMFSIGVEYFAEMINDHRKIISEKYSTLITLVMFKRLESCVTLGVEKFTIGKCRSKELVR